LQPFPRALFGFVGIVPAIQDCDFYFEFLDRARQKSLSEYSFCFSRFMAASQRKQRATSRVSEYGGDR
jgi:hypothetical protein